jgi:hypothetical protein
MDVRKIEWEIVDWIHVAEDSDKWRALWKKVMKFPVP